MKILNKFKSVVSYGDGGRMIPKAQSGWWKTGLLYRHNSTLDDYKNYIIDSIRRKKNYDLADRIGYSGMYDLKSLTNYLNQHQSDLERNYNLWKKNDRLNNFDSWAEDNGYVQQGFLPGGRYLDKNGNWYSKEELQNLFNNRNNKTQLLSPKSSNPLFTQFRINDKGFNEGLINGLWRELTGKEALENEAALRSLLSNHNFSQRTENSNQQTSNNTSKDWDLEATKNGFTDRGTNTAFTGMNDLQKAEWNAFKNQTPSEKNYTITYHSEKPVSETETMNNILKPSINQGMLISLNNSFNLANPEFTYDPNEYKSAGHARLGINKFGGVLKLFKSKNITIG